MSKSEIELKYEKVETMIKEFNKNARQSNYGCYAEDATQFLDLLISFINDQCKHGKDKDKECVYCKRDEFLIEGEKKIEDRIGSFKCYHWGKYPQINIDKAAIHYRIECKDKIQILEHKVFFTELDKLNREMGIYNTKE